MEIITVKYANPEQTSIIVNGEAVVPIDPANRHYAAIMEWVAAGNTIEPYLQTLDEVKAAKIAEIKQAYEDALLQGYVCSNGIKMDAKQSDVQLLDDGLRLAQKLGATTMNIRDFDNVVHPDMPLTEVDAMVSELGLNAYTLMQKKWALTDQVNAATTITEVEVVIW